MLWGDLADGDGGGNGSLVEYALGTDPGSPLIEEDGISAECDGDSVELTYQKIRDPNRIDFIIFDKIEHF
ncbi:MAG: hypothetical protein L7T84_07520 [Akkermansiaceae bacterium]|nr:hypothetical protein [Akkermansiaceae bacterium]